MVMLGLSESMSDYDDDDARSVQEYVWLWFVFTDLGCVCW